MSITLPTTFNVLPRSGRDNFRLGEHIGKGGEIQATLDNEMMLWGEANRSMLFDWANPVHPLEETATSYVARLEDTATPHAERWGNSASDANYWIDSYGGYVKIEIFQSDGTTLITSVVVSQTTSRGVDTGTLDMSSANAGDIVIRVSVYQSGASSEVSLYGVYVQEAKMAIGDFA